MKELAEWFGLEIERIAVDELLSTRSARRAPDALSITANVACYLSRSCQNTSLQAVNGHCPGAAIVWRGL